MVILGTSPVEDCLPKSCIAIFIFPFMMCKPNHHLCQTIDAPPQSVIFARYLVRPLINLAKTIGNLNINNKAYI